ncbi:hypothetical protein SLS56_007119 [Neofusicoccum ribis]|uniref:Uncharacterized protein n=1 Tax=Neofusicoccum ribis TaxID=45134 RepID=A0ABR3SP95_9PEZI
MHFLQSSYLVGAAALAGAVAVPAPVPDVPVVVADIPTPSVLGADPTVYSSTASSVNAETVTAVATGTTDTAMATAIGAPTVPAAAFTIDPSMVQHATNLPSSLPPSILSQISAAVPTDSASAAALRSAIAALPSGALPAQLASLASDLLPAPSAGSKVKRITEDPAAKCTRTGWDCCQLPVGHAFSATSPDTAEAFLANGAFSAAASGSSASAPAQYSKVFTGLQGATQQAGYRGVYTLDSYSASDCAAHCNNDPWCMAFNLYVERDPTIRPDYPEQGVCSDPASTAIVKCTLYGYPISDTTATNTGQWQGGFHVVIAGSNGYNKILSPPAAQSNFNGPLGSNGNALPGAIENLNKYYLYEFYTGPFDPAYCASGCQANTAYNKAHLRDSNGWYTACNAFNAYVLYADGEAKGTTCAYYSDTLTDWDLRNQATNVGQYQGNVHITVGQSYVYNLAVWDNGGYTGFPTCNGVHASPLCD